VFNVFLFLEIKLVFALLKIKLVMRELERKILEQVHIEEPRHSAQTALSLMALTINIIISHAD
jgi:hypothetical protein